MTYRVCKNTHAEQVVKLIGMYNSQNLDMKKLHISLGIVF